MNGVFKAAVALLAGLLGFVAGTLVVTASLDPYIWPSLIVGLPVGLVVGATLLVATLSGLRYRERRATDELTPGVVAMVRAGIVGVAACVVVVPVGVVAVVTGFGQLGIALLVAGLPAAVLLAGTVAYLTTDRTGRSGRGQTA